MGYCKNCQQKIKDGIWAGQMITEWQCSICGKTFEHENTDVPCVCKECSEKNNVCEYCSGKIDDSNDMNSADK